MLELVVVIWLAVAFTLYLMMLLDLKGFYRQVVEPNSVKNKTIVWVAAILTILFAGPFLVIGALIKIAKNQ